MMYHFDITGQLERQTNREKCYINMCTSILVRDKNIRYQYVP